jgi:RNA polymerase sigma-70 factor (ECF subfamily)
MAEPQGNRLQYRSNPEQPWSTLLRRIAEREPAALAALYDGTSALVYSVALAILSNTEDAEEITVDVYAYVWQSAGTYDSSRGTVTTWLIMLARSRAIERLRKRVERKDTRNQNNAIERLPSNSAACNASVAGQDRAILIETALHQLPTKDQELIRGAFFSGFSHPELALKLNIPLGTVKTRIRTILSHLRNSLE